MDGSVFVTNVVLASYCIAVDECSRDPMDPVSMSPNLVLCDMEPMVVLLHLDGRVTMLPVHSPMCRTGKQP